ncbi:ribonuclease P protein component [Salinisphaera sp. Q1T1-3]|uniref:ribonuclease P protein component n=1 Tax=Salinisphaera sp. Q1T1-3 TaxID=2321229 RepID=UPI000E741FB8|nr:ribonuclease P protein component [Salinisphaera sp. Q1T1-3]RJS92568.1 ribonuclease P protein component [Salinisphaera sp. Q1T1-3]
MSQAAFPREARLLRPPQFRAVFARGEKFVCPGFVVIAATSENTQARLGLALAKRRIRRAVDRNRVKRIVRESFRRHRDEIGGIDVVVLARSRTDRIDNADLFDQLTRLWGRIAASPASTRSEP